MRRHFLPFLLAIALVVTALRGGSYDDVDRGELYFLAWWLLGLSVAFGVLPHVRLSRSAAVAVAALTALAVWTAIGATWSDSVGRTVHEATRTLGYAGILLLIAWTVGANRWQRAAAALAAGAIIVCCLALTSRLVPGLTSELEQTGYDTRRLNYPMNYWNAVGIWAAMTVGLALPWSAHARRWQWRAIALGGVCVAVLVSYLTYSRAAAVGVVVSALTVIALCRNRWLAALHALLAAAGSVAVILSIRAHPQIADASGYRGAGAVALVLAASLVGCGVVAYLTAIGGIDRVRLAPRAARAALAAAGVAALLATVAVGPTLAREAWDSFQQRQEVSSEGDPARRLTDLSGERRVLWASALRTFREHPLEGAGAGTFEFTWNRDQNWSHYVRDAHSLYLEALAEVGLPGALLLTVALGALLLASVRLSLRQHDPEAAGAAAGCAAALLTFCMTAGVDWMWESTAVTTAALACGAVTVAAGSRRVRDSRALPRLGVGLMAVIGIGFQAPALLAATEISASQAAVREGRIAGAVTAASIALHAEPWSAEGYLQRALVLERQGFLDAAAKDARDAVDREPDNAQNWLILARIEAERDQVEAAIAAATTARRLHPRHPAFASP